MVTIIMLVSRPDYLLRIFAQLEMLSCDSVLTSLLVYVDGDLELYQKARNLCEGSKFGQRLCLFRKRGQPSVGSVHRRRQRIADIHNEIKTELAPTDYVFLIEDDTLVPINALKKLMSVAELRSDVGIVSGIELGRWGYEHIGAWRVDDVYETRVIKSVPLGEGVQPVDATGLYCCVMRAKLYLEHTFAPMEAIGPDVELGLWLRQQGYKNYVDFDVRCHHLTKRGAIEVGKSAIVVVKLEKQENGKWAQGVDV